ncbi:MAG TPA: glycosyltransferase [Candidatus Saccharimonadales bacterium]|nr:glycosyltransferase [Candidatus Saccharimonadales bacterium]
MKDISKLKVAIVHDWLIGGGAEQVVLELHLMFPEAPIYTSYCTEEWRRRLNFKVITGSLQHWPFNHLRKYIPFLRAWWFSHLNLTGYDLVISSSGAEAKAVKVVKPTIHVNYCHAPTHYYWSRYDEYMKNPGFGIFNSLARFGLKTLVGPMRKWDLKASQRADYMIANSTYTQAQIKKYYSRDSFVIHPPVDVEKFTGDVTIETKKFGLVAAGRQVPYKRFDLVVDACTKLELPLTVIGNGPEHRKLVKRAGQSIVFASKVTEIQIIDYFKSAAGFVFPGVDDFGIVAVEAMAAGTPVIAFRSGGALDYVVEGKTGLFFNAATAETLADTLSQFNPAKFSVTEVQATANQFNKAMFQQHILDYLAKIMV